MRHTGEARRRAILKALLEHGRFPAPSMRELMEPSGLRSTSAVKFHLDRLREEGYVTYAPRLSRTVRLTARGYVEALRDD